MIDNIFLFLFFCLYFLMGLIIWLGLLISFGAAIWTLLITGAEDPVGMIVIAILALLCSSVGWIMMKAALITMDEDVVW